MKLLGLFRRPQFPEVERRLNERRTGCFQPRSPEEEWEAQQETREMHRRLHRIQIELDVLRRGQ